MGTLVLGKIFYKGDCGLWGGSEMKKMKERVMIVIRWWWKRICDGREDNNVVNGEMKLVIEVIL